MKGRKVRCVEKLVRKEGRRDTNKGKTGGWKEGEGRRGRKRVKGIQIH